MNAKDEVKHIFTLLSGDDREAILHYLQQNDRNGFYTDKLCDAEDLPHLGIEEARGYLEKVLAECFDEQLVSSFSEGE
jgi:hypothetical protein